MGVNQSYRVKGYNAQFNLVLFVSLILAGIGVGWLALNKVDAGYQYTIIFLLTSVIFLLGFFFVKEEDNEFLNKFIKAPLTTDYDLAVPLYLIGWIAPFFVNFIIGAFGGSFNIAQLMVPFSGADIDQKILQSFSAVELSADPFWRWFVMVFSAGSIEEFGWGLALMVVFGLMGMFILKMLNDGKDLPFISAKNFIFTFALGMTMFTFSGVHMLNSTYTVASMFIVAMVFRLIMNLWIYVWGLFLSFSMGYHQSNNAIYFYYTYGPQTTWSALLSLKGLIILFFFAIMIYYVLRRFPIIRKKIAGLYT